MRRAVLVISCLLVLAGRAFGPVDAAQACSTVGEEHPVRVPTAPVPGNLIRIAVFETSPSLELTLRNVDSGETIPSSVRSLGGDLVLVPDAPVAAGQRLAVVESWSNGNGFLSARDPEGAREQEHEFTTSEHVATALREPKLTLLEHHGASAKYRYDSPDATGNLGSLLDVDVRVHNGHVYGVERTGAGTYEFELRTTCDGTVTEDSCGGIHTFSEGEHQVEVHAHVLGQDEQPKTLTEQVVLSCHEGCAVTGKRTNDALLMLLPLLLLALQSRRRTARGGAHADAIHTKGDASPSARRRSALDLFDYV